MIWATIKRMQKRNYQKELDAIIESDKEVGIKPRLLMHSCCAPCSSYVMEYLREHFKLTMFFYNPNMDSASEYSKRADELKRLIDCMNDEGMSAHIHEHVQTDSALSDCRVCNLDCGNDNGSRFSSDDNKVHRKDTGQEEQDKQKDRSEGRIELITADYDPDSFLRIAKGHENDPERGERCMLCYRLRLQKTAEYMQAHHDEFDYFATTLTLSPLKNAEALNTIAEELASEYGLKSLPTDFKKRNGYKRSIELSDIYGLYRQNYCGCAFSKAEAMRREAERVSVDG